MHSIEIIVKLVQFYLLNRITGINKPGFIVLLNTIMTAGMVGSFLGVV